MKLSEKIFMFRKQKGFSQEEMVFALQIMCFVIRHTYHRMAISIKR